MTSGSTPDKPRRTGSRRSAGAQRGSKSDEGDARDARVAKRLESERRKVKAAERKEPLMRRVMQALADHPTTTTGLTGIVGSDGSTINRLLKALTENGLVESEGVEGDKRLRLYRLTVEGELRLNEHRAFGDREAAPVAPDDETVRRFLRSAIRNAIKLRRQTNRLEDAAIRLQRVRREADKLGAFHITLDAMAELSTTFSRQRKFAEVEALVEEMRCIAAGEHASKDPKLVLPAAAYYRHALGHMPVDRKYGSLGEKASHLDSAQSLFDELRVTEPKSELDWGSREAWSIFGLASNFRKRWSIDKAIATTGHAFRLFNELDDVYGRSRCLLMFGLCARLRWYFGNAALLLEEALAVASSNEFPRVQAEVLMQFGEVRRCQGDTRHARTMLEESLRITERMDLHPINALAQSALGAVACQEQRLDDARSALQRAEDRFINSGDLEGRALNARRQAVVYRRLADEGHSHYLTDAHAFVVVALESYKLLRSTAGEAASEIEQARITRRKGGKAVQPIRNLLIRLRRTPERNNLELDPWVPKVLDNFAREMGDRDLEELAPLLLEASETRLIAWTKEALAPAVDGNLKQVRHGRKHDGGAWEMGGEPEADRDYALRQSTAI